MALSSDILAYVQQQEVEWSEVAPATSNQRQTIYKLVRVVIGRKLTKAERNRMSDKANSLSQTEADEAIRDLVSRIA